MTVGSARPPRHPEDAAKGRGSVLSYMGKSFTASMAGKFSLFGKVIPRNLAAHGRDFTLPQASV